MAEETSKKQEDKETKTAEKIVKAVPEKAVPEKAVPEKAVPKKAAPKKAAPEKAVPEKAVPEKAAPEKAVQEKAVQEKAVQEKAVPEKAVQEKAVQEKAVPEKAVQEKAEPEKPKEKAVVADEKKPQTYKASKEKQSKEKPKDESPEKKQVAYKADTEVVSDFKKATGALLKTFGKNFKIKIWPYLNPIVVLVLICVITSALLGITNGATKPIITENEQVAAQEARKLLLPEADTFDAEEIPDGHEDVVAIYKATNGAGYIIEAQGRGYGGKVPAMVAFDEDANVKGVTFPSNNETPGLGQKLVTNLDFAKQFEGMKNISVQLSDVDAIASATISTNAGISAVNAAIAVYNQQVMGIDPENLTPDQVLSMLLPQAGALTEIVVDIENVTQAYKGDDGNYIIFATQPASQDKRITAAVSMDENGKILGLWLDTSNQGKGYGTEVQSNQEFIDGFVGQTQPANVDAVASATLTSDAVNTAVNTALQALNEVKGAA